MRLPEWTATLMAECRAAGFEVSEHAGFPLVKRPSDLANGARFLKHKFSLAVERSIYAEGCLLLPPGSQHMMSEHRRKDLEPSDEADK
jgi:hypothetical protein